MNSVHGIGGRRLAAKRALGVTPTDDAIERIEDEEALVRALASLTARQRAAVVLVDLPGYSEEAGQMHGITASTVRTHVERSPHRTAPRPDAPRPRASGPDPELLGNPKTRALAELLIGCEVAPIAGLPQCVPLTADPPRQARPSPLRRRGRPYARTVGK